MPLASLGTPLTHYFDHSSGGAAAAAAVAAVLLPSPSDAKQTPPLHLVPPFFPPSLRVSILTTTKRSSERLTVAAEVQEREELTILYDNKPSIHTSAALRNYHQYAAVAVLRLLRPRARQRPAHPPSYSSYLQDGGKEYPKQSTLSIEHHRVK
eukprot:GHVU01061053.1.p1 GENE.GHVU01061053.1~~GHVU01061053.1.p1  ORF type:complete len:153 (-),score=23.32 GHVU01061053.1:18-476(-)